MKTQSSSKELFQAIVHGRFATNFIKNVYPGEPPHKIAWTATDEVTDLNGRRHDIVYLFRPGKKECSHATEMDYRYRVVSIETKNSQSDLMKDGKILSYLGATSYAFLAVPERLIPDAIDKIDSYDDRAQYIGLINADNGDIILFPASQEELLDRARQDRLLASMFLSPKRNDDPDDEYILHKHTTGYAEPDVFVEHGDYYVNREYLDDYFED